MSKTGGKTSHGTSGAAAMAYGLMLAAGLQVCLAGPLRAQETTVGNGPSLRFEQFDQPPAQRQAVWPHRSHPFGVYRTDTLNKTGPEYSGWSHLTPNQAWRGSSTNLPSRRRYGLLGEQ